MFKLVTLLNIKLEPQEPRAVPLDKASNGPHAEEPGESLSLERQALQQPGSGRACSHERPVAKICPLKCDGTHRFCSGRVWKTSLLP